MPSEDSSIATQGREEGIDSVKNVAEQQSDGNKDEAEMIQKTP